MTLGSLGILAVIVFVSGIIGGFFNGLRTDNGRWESGTLEGANLAPGQSTHRSMGRSSSVEGVSIRCTRRKTWGRPCKDHR
jgi:hypothetical protein